MPGGLLMFPMKCGMVNKGKVEGVREYEA